MAQFVKVAAVTEIQPGQGKAVAVADREIALFNCGGQFYAIDNTCPHHGGPLGDGDLDGSVVTCPWHGWRFDVRTGVSPVVPSAKVNRFEVKVEGNDILVAI